MVPLREYLNDAADVVRNIPSKESSIKGDVI
jgi:hypothetical protein